MKKFIISYKKKINDKKNKKRKKYGHLYLAREFIIMRHVLKTDDGIFILEKSITDNE